ncbi:MAG: DUF4339 domain-containing protein [Planctomycetota bacterium]
MLASSGEALVQIIFALAFGIACALIANNRGRSSVAWFFIGFFFSCLALIILLCITDLKQEAQRDQRHQQETRRLREQIAKERQVADSRHAEVGRRLVAHDQVLGVDTANVPELTSSASKSLSGGAAGQWFYAIEDQRYGPVSLETVAHLLKAGAIDRESLVWQQGMAGWTPLGDVPELSGGAA